MTGQSPDKLLLRRKTQHQTIDVTQLQDGTYALFLDGNIQFASGVDDENYHRTLADVPLAMFRGAPVRVLILGGGDGLAARNLLRHQNVVGVTMVELDRGVLEVCSTHPVLRSLNEDAFRSPKLKVKVGDARQFVCGPRTMAAYDLALIDFPDPTEEIADLYDWPFYQELLKHMNGTRAVIAVQSSTSGSPIEELVATNLGYAMSCEPTRHRFTGRCMEAGVIVVGDTARRA